MTDRYRCACADHSRRIFSAALLSGGLGWGGTAAANIPECKRSSATKFVSAESVESSSRQQYQQMMRQASGQRALASNDEPQLQRLRYIAQRMIPFTPECNERAQQWRWEVNLLNSRSINAFCMPGGKIAFFYGILSELQLDDDEVAMVMGHEVAHALLEHAREQAGKNTVTTGVLRLGAALFGLGQLGDLAAQGGGYLASLKFSRDDESEADRLGQVMAARAGYDPRKGITLWQKMMGAGGGKPPGWLSTHPPSDERIRQIRDQLPQVLPRFESATRPERRFGPPPRLPPARAGTRE
jgi:predicted Zn-dependent protease